jgi:TPP-dependent 2-oxoacid decarboxylase
MTQATIATYIIARLKQAGLRHAFGVPGDYVLSFMDRLMEEGIELIGTCNELNPGYAADAYARIKGIGCVCVTWGVGGFSAMNAIAGAYAEQVPLVVLVGGPRTTQRRSAMLLHHSVGDFGTMQQAYSHITAAAVMLDDPAEAPQRIDRAFARCIAEKRPIMIEIPADMVDLPCAAPRPVAAPARPPSDPDALAEALDEVMGLLLTAGRPVILGGVELHRYGLMAEFRRLVETSRVPVATTLLGKTVISEHHLQAIGVYEGGISRREVRDIVDQAFYLSIGYALPATLGAALADPARRPVTLIGDGAFQMTAQELSSLCRRRTGAILLLMNNDGYTTERIIHEGPYNDIQPWAYHRLPEVLGPARGNRGRARRLPCASPRQQRGAGPHRGHARSLRYQRGAEAAMRGAIAGQGAAGGQGLTKQEPRAKGDPGRI